MIAALFELGIEFLFERTGLVEEIDEAPLAIDRIGGGEALELSTEFAMDRAGTVQGVLESSEAAVIPERLELFGRSFNEGHVEVDVGGLADAVETSDALFEEPRIIR
jgi:hypothetical protein